METGSERKLSATPNGQDRGTSESAVVDSPSWALPVPSRPVAAIATTSGAIVASPKLFHRS
ncbi:hypothetical protein PG989_012964 [Apiospora arundinis]